MIKVFQKNKNGKVELSIEQLEKILNEAYWEGYNNKTTWTYTTPQWSYVTNTSDDNNITLTTPNKITIATPLSSSQTRK